MFEGLLLPWQQSKMLFFIQFLKQLLKFLVNFTLLKYVKSQRSYGFLITKELIFGFQILDLKDHFSAYLCFYFKYSISYKVYNLDDNNFETGINILGHAPKNRVGTLKARHFNCLLNMSNS